MAISNTIKKVGKKVVDVASDVMSGFAPQRAANNQKKVDAQVKDIKMVREMKKVPDGGDYRDPLFRARANVSNMKADYEMDYAKKMSKKPTRF